MKQFSKDHKIELSTAENVLWLAIVLREISNSSIGKDFALIGGSALVFLYRNMYRFSTDLDIDFIGNKDLGIKSTNEVAQRMNADKKVFTKIASDLGLEFRQLSKKERFVRYELIFSKRREGAVELDVSYRYCHSILGPVSKNWQMTSGGIIAPFKVQTQKLEELYASKITAIVEVEDDERVDFPEGIGILFKRKARHLFDLYKLIDDISHNKNPIKLTLLHNLVVLFGMTRIRGFEYRRGDAIGEYTEKQFEEELVPVISQDAITADPEHVKWAIRKFFDSHIFNWGEREYRFVEDYKNNLFRPEDLFGKGTIASQLKTMHYYKEIMKEVVPLRKLNKRKSKRK